MPENQVGRFGALLSQLPRVFSQVQLLIWAGNYRRGADLIARFDSQHRNTLHYAEELGQLLIKSKRDPGLREQLTRELQSDSGIRGFKFLIKDKLAATVAERTPYQGEEFLAALLALAYRSLKQRVLESGQIEDAQTPRGKGTKKAPIQPPVLASLDEGTGFHFLELSKDPGRIEVRAYRSDGQSMAAPEFVTRLRQVWQEARITLEEGSERGGEQWPVWFRAFTRDAFVEGLATDPNIAWLECTAMDTERAREIYQGILAALTPNSRFHN